MGNSPSTLKITLFEAFDMNLNVILVSIPRRKHLWWGQSSK